MKALLLCVCISSFLPAAVGDQSAETGNGDLIRQAFHPEARVFWVSDDALMQLTGEEFAARFSGYRHP